MYVYYSEEEADAELDDRRPSLYGPDRTFRRANRAWKVLITACSFAFAVVMVSAIILHRFPWWADVLGIAVAVFACIQWNPQVRTPWHLGRLGSLGPVAICLTAPVGLVFRSAKLTTSRWSKYTWIFGINRVIRVGLKG
ncbi:hypothetical protein FOPE_08380 [Fonsecaea pedrosoi]|nr:hypothetical protein FOPE_08380 [Fonsecaea pedrosoi]